MCSRHTFVGDQQIFAYILIVCRCLCVPCDDIVYVCVSVRAMMGSLCLTWKIGCSCAGQEWTWQLVLRLWYVVQRR